MTKLQLKKAKTQGEDLGYAVAKEYYHGLPVPKLTDPKFLAENFISKCLDIVYTKKAAYYRGKYGEAYELGTLIGIKRFLNKRAGVSVPRAFEVGFRKGLKKRWE